MKHSGDKDFWFQRSREEVCPVLEGKEVLPQRPNSLREREFFEQWFKGREEVNNAGS